MAQIGKWGKTQFKVNAKKALTFKNMKRSYSARWATHDIAGKRPKLEFQGPDMDEISVEIILDAELGVSPRKTMKTLRAAAKRGEVYYFYIGGKKVAINKFYIASGTENWNEIWSRGELVRATASITFGEYR